MLLNGLMTLFEVRTWPHGAVTHEGEIVRVMIMPNPCVPEKGSMDGEVKRGSVCVLE